VKSSGIGRYHGPEGLINFSNTKSVMLNKSKKTHEINWFPFSEDVYNDLELYLKTYYGGKSIFKKMSSLVPLFIRMLKN